MEVNRSLRIKLSEEEFNILRKAYNVLDDISSELEKADANFFSLLPEGSFNLALRTATDVDNARDYLERFIR